MAKNPLWVLDKLGPVVFEYTEKLVRENKNVVVGSPKGHFLYYAHTLRQELNQDKDYIHAEEYCQRLQRINGLPAFIAWCLDTLPRNSVEYHALLMFIRYYGI